MENIIKSLRKEKGLTQVQLAEAFNLDQTAISKWENGKALPDTQMLIRLAEFFDVSTDYLLGRSTLYYPDRIQAENKKLSKNGKELLDIFNDLPAEYQAQILEYARYFETRNTVSKRKNKNGA